MRRCNYMYVHMYVPTPDPTGSYIDTSVLTAYQPSPLPSPPVAHCRSPTLGGPLSLRNLGLLGCKACLGKINRYWASEMVVS